MQKKGKKLMNTVHDPLSNFIQFRWLLPPNHELLELALKEKPVRVEKHLILWGDMETWLWSVGEGAYKSTYVGQEYKSPKDLKKMGTYKVLGTVIFNAYSIQWFDHILTVNVYKGDLAGLIIAEVLVHNTAIFGVTIPLGAKAIGAEHKEFLPEVLAIKGLPDLSRWFSQK